MAEKLGVTPSAVGNWEAGINGPRKKAIHRFAEILGVSVEFLTEGPSATRGLPPAPAPAPNTAAEKPKAGNSLATQFPISEEQMVSRLADAPRRRHRDDLEALVIFVCQPMSPSTILGLIEGVSRADLSMQTRDRVVELLAQQLKAKMKDLRPG